MLKIAMEVGRSTLLCSYLLMVILYVRIIESRSTTVNGKLYTSTTVATPKQQEETTTTDTTEKTESLLKATIETSNQSSVSKLSDTPPDLSNSPNRKLDTTVSTIPSTTKLESMTTSGRTGLTGYTTLTSPGILENFEQNMVAKVSTQEIQLSTASTVDSKMLSKTTDTTTQPVTTLNPVTGTIQQATSTKQIQSLKSTTPTVTSEPLGTQNSISETSPTANKTITTLSTTPIVPRESQNPVTKTMSTSTKTLITSTKTTNPKPTSKAMKMTTSKELTPTETTTNTESATTSTITTTTTLLSTTIKTTETPTTMKTTTATLPETPTTLQTTTTTPSTTTTATTTIKTTTTTATESVVKTCKQGINCKLPSCFCPMFTHLLKKEKMPQIVYFGFDDEVQMLYKQYYDNLFHKTRKNPNGCPITMTLYVSHVNTDYNLVKHYYDGGNEIASHSVTHKLIKTKSTLLEEAKKQKDNIVTLAGIPANKVTGWRSPYLEPAGDDQVNVLQMLGYEYDISHTYIPLGRPTAPTKDPWPFTLDYSGWPFICQILSCPKSVHKGFWEVPISVLSDLKKENLCAFVDSCTNAPNNENEVFNYLWNNFEVNYRENKAPFGLHLHARWFNTPHNLKGVDKFIRELLKLNDVYIVSVQKMLEWMRNPKQLSDIGKFEPWMCGDTVLNTESTSVGTTTTSTMSTTLPPQKSVSVVQSCQQGSNCKLPSCFCPTFDHTMNLKDIPQIVYFGFDDEVQWSYKRYYDSLFLGNRKNPNGCPISMTLFVSHLNTDYDLVKYYYDKGNEIASHSVSHKLIKTKASVLKEARKQRKNINETAGIPLEKITGWRSPFLEPAGDDQVNVLQMLGYEYDISHTYIPLGRPTTPTKDPWPFTLDYSGWPFICQILSCPKSVHKGFWEVPINVLSDPKQENLCAFVDSCTNAPNNEKEVFNYLWNNFEVNYRGNRAPFGLHLHASWFNTPHNLKGVDKFIRELLKSNYKDVFIVSIQKMLEWMKNPVKIGNVGNFKPWMC